RSTARTTRPPLPAALPTFEHNPPHVVLGQEPMSPQHVPPHLLVPLQYLLRRPTCQKLMVHQPNGPGPVHDEQVPLTPVHPHNLIRAGAEDGSFKLLLGLNHGEVVVLFGPLGVPLQQGLYHVGVFGDVLRYHHSLGHLLPRQTEYHMGLGPMGAAVRRLPRVVRLQGYVAAGAYVQALLWPPWP